MLVELKNSLALPPVDFRSHIRKLDVSHVTAAMLGLAGPVAAGALLGHLEAGMAASLGGLALSGTPRGARSREYALSLVYSVFTGTAAILAGSALGSHRIWAAFGIPLIAAVFGLFGSISRPLARSSTRFVLYAIIAAGLGAGGADPLGTSLLFFIGAAWTAALFLISSLLPPAIGKAPISPDSGNHARRSDPRPKQLLHRWWNSLAHLTGWQYPVRILICLLAAQALEWIWPLRHGQWIGLTVGIVVHRDLQNSLNRTLQRAVGTLTGVLLSFLLTLTALPAWALIAIIALLSAARSILREFNYTAYATVHTPLIILLIDLGRMPSGGVIADRLAATMAGCAISVTLGYLLWFKLRKEPKTSAANLAPPRDDA
jgi:uncharacterized membrane protein YccC